VTVAAKSSVVDEQSLRTTIRNLIRELAPNQLVIELNAEHRLVEDLGYHSLALMELAFTLEDEFGLDPLDEQQALKIELAGDVEQHVIGELTRKHVLKSSGVDQQGA